MARDEQRAITCSPKACVASIMALRSSGVPAAAADVNNNEPNWRWGSCTAAAAGCKVVGHVVPKRRVVGMLGHLNGGKSHGNRVMMRARYRHELHRSVPSRLDAGQHVLRKLKVAEEVQSKSVAKRRVKGGGGGTC